MSEIVTRQVFKSKYCFILVLLIYQFGNFDLHMIGIFKFLTQIV